MTCTFCKENTATILHVLAKVSTSSIKGLEFAVAVLLIFFRCDAASRLYTSAGELPNMEEGHVREEKRRIIRISEGKKEVPGMPHLKSQVKRFPGS